MTTEAVSLPELLRAVIDRRLFEVHVSMPGTVESYDVNNRRADIRVGTNPTDPGDASKNLPGRLIKNVPIEFLAGGGWVVSFPLKKGDGVRLSFHDYSIDQWLERGGAVDVVDTRNHHESDASAYPGLRAKPDKIASASATKFILGKDDTPSLQITIDPDVGVINISDNATDFVALAQKVLTELNKFKTYLSALDAVFGSGVTEAGMGAPSALALALKAASLAAGGVPSPSSVAAQKVKAE